METAHIRVSHLLGCLRSYSGRTKGEGKRGKERGKTKEKLLVSSARGASWGVEDCPKRKASHGKKLQQVRVLKKMKKRTLGDGNQGKKKD